MLALAVGLGLLMGLVIGSLGGGGSILTVPALVYVLGLSAQAATSASLVIVGLTAGVAAVSHTRSGHTRWKAGLLLAGVGLPASLLGTWLNARVDENVLLLAFAALMVVAAAGMLVRAGDSSDDSDSDSDSGSGSGGDRGSDSGTGDRGDDGAEAATDGGSRRRSIRVVAAGLVIGALTGFFGVGGGFVIVPALVVVLRFSMPIAVGTSLLVIALNSVVALAARTGRGDFDWAVIVPFTLAAVVASLIGQRLAERLPGPALTRAFAVLLIAVAVYVAVRAGLALG